MISSALRARGRPLANRSGKNHGSIQTKPIVKEIATPRPTATATGASPKIIIGNATPAATDSNPSQAGQPERL